MAPSDPTGNGTQRPSHWMSPFLPAPARRCLCRHLPRAKSLKAVRPQLQVKELPSSERMAEQQSTASNQEHIRSSLDSLAKLKTHPHVVGTRSTTFPSLSPPSPRGRNPNIPHPDQLWAICGTIALTQLSARDGGWVRPKWQMAGVRVSTTQHDQRSCFRKSAWTERRSGACDITRYVPVLGQ